MFVSMWISNTAAVAMMIPIMQAVLEELEAVSLTEEIKSISRKLNNLTHKTTKHFPIYSKDFARCILMMIQNPKKKEC